MFPLVGSVVFLAESAGGPGVGALLTNILSDPLSIVLIATGAVLIGLSVSALGYLVLGSVVEFVTPDVSRGPPPQDR